MRGGRRATGILACAALAACGGVGEERRRLPPLPDLRLWAPPIVRWDPGSPRHVDFAIENPTNRTIAIAAPHPRAARVDVLSGPEAVRVCGTVPAPDPAPRERVTLAPGDRIPVRVDLEAECGDVPPGEYRYEVSYRAVEPETGGGFEGTLPARYGQLFVRAVPRTAAWRGDPGEAACTPCGPPAGRGPAPPPEAAPVPERWSERPAAPGPRERR